MSRAVVFDKEDPEIKKMIAARPKRAPKKVMTNMKKLLAAYEYRPKEIAAVVKQAEKNKLGGIAQLRGRSWVVQAEDLIKWLSRSE